MLLRAVGRRFTQMNAYFLVMNSKRWVVLAWVTDGMHHCVCCVLVIKRKTLPYNAGNLQQRRAKPTSTNEECGKVRQKHFRSQPEVLAAEPKWVVGHHPLVNSISGWMIVPYMQKGQWLILCCCPIIGGGITNFLQILAILPSSLRCPPDIPVACAPPPPLRAFTPLAWENSRHLATPPLVSPRYSHIPRGWGVEKRWTDEKGYFYSGL